MISRVMRPERAPFHKIGFLTNKDCNKQIKQWCQKNYKPQVSGSELYTVLDLNPVASLYEMGCVIESNINKIHPYNKSMLPCFWGQVMESVVRERFKILFNIKQVVNPLREVINEIYSVPDGQVDDVDSPLNGFLVEFKCLYSGKLPNRPLQEHYVQCQAHMQSNNNERTLLIYWSPTGFVVYLIYRNSKIWDQIWSVAQHQQAYIAKKNLAKDAADFTVYTREWSHNDKYLLTAVIHDGLSESNRIISFLVKETENEYREIVANNKDLLPLTSEKEAQLIRICGLKD